MNEQMEFPETFQKFAKEYGFKDDKEVYTNGSDLIPIFRVNQWLEHDNKLRKIETDIVANAVNYNAQILKDALNRIAELEKTIKLKAESEESE